MKRKRRTKRKIKFRVWFEQVNQSAYAVKGYNENDAIKQARKEWVSENSEPIFAEIEYVYKRAVEMQR